MLTLIAMTLLAVAGVAARVWLAIAPVIEILPSPLAQDHRGFLVRTGAAWRVARSE